MSVGVLLFFLTVVVLAFLIGFVVGFSVDLLVLLK